MSNLILPGFSPVNRGILYASLTLAPAQALSGFDTRWPSNIGFLAYHCYQQYLWLRGVKTRRGLHALCLVPVHLNMVTPITYSGGIPAKNRLMMLLQGIVTIAMVLLNTYTMWISWSERFPEGYGEYRFSLGVAWTLSPTWKLFYALWGAWNTIWSAVMVISVLWVTTCGLLCGGEDDEEGWVKWLLKKLDICGIGVVWRAIAFLWGALCILLLVWPFIFWTEKIVKHNQIVSETDMTSVGLFVTQVVLMIAGAIRTRINQSHADAY